MWIRMRAFGVSLCDPLFSSPHTNRRRSARTRRSPENVCLCGCGCGTTVDGRVGCRARGAVGAVGAVPRGRAPRDASRPRYGYRARRVCVINEPRRPARALGAVLSTRPLCVERVWALVRATHRHTHKTPCARRHADVHLRPPLPPALSLPNGHTLSSKRTSVWPRQLLSDGRRWTCMRSARCPPLRDRHCDCALLRPLKARSQPTPTQHASAGVRASRARLHCSGVVLLGRRRGRDKRVWRELGGRALAWAVDRVLLPRRECAVGGGGFARGGRALPRTYG